MLDQQLLPPKRPLLIGLLVDSSFLPTHYYDLCKWANSQESICITHLIVQNIPIRKKSSFPPPIRLVYNICKSGFFNYLGNILFAFIVSIEQRRLSTDTQKAWLHSHDVSLFVEKSITITPHISPSGFVYQYELSELSQIKSLNLDLIIRCGSGILKGDIFNSSKYGILSFHHGDNRVNRGGPAGFWEVFYKHPTTGFVIQRLNDILDGGDILFRGSFPTASSFVLNQINVRSRSLFYLQQLLLDIQRFGKLPPFQEKLPYSNRLYRSPKFLAVLKYFIQQICKALVGRYRSFFNYKETWAVAFSRCNWRDLVMWKSTKIPNPPGRFFADPFLLSHDGKDYCFVEDFSYSSDKGSISVLELSATSALFKATVLQEDFHLSFPFIFSYNHTYYMVPESCNAMQIRLYECIDFPFNWRFHSVLIDNVSASDSMIFFMNDLWWLFTNINPDDGRDHCSELFAFYSDDPINGSWSSHSMNPLIVDPLRARNGGLLSDGDFIYRVSQRQGFLKYGEQFSINRIVILNPEEFIETEISSASPDFFPNIIGTHHLHSNSNLSVFDFSYDKRISNTP